MSGITQGWKGEVWLADYGIRLPAMKGTKLDAPEGFRAEGLVSNAVVPINYVAGLQWPVLSVPLYVTANWFYVDLLDTMLGVPNRLEPVLGGLGGWYGFPRDLISADLASIGRVQVWNGAVGWELEASKCCLFSVALPRMGDYVRAQLVFWGLSIQQIGWDQTQTAFTQRAARSQNTGHNLPVNPLSWSLTVRNPLRPNMSFLPIPPPGNERFFAPLEHNSGTLSVQANLTVQAHHQQGGIADGTPFYFRIVPPGGASVGLNVTNPLWSDRYAYEFGTDRQRAPLSCVGRGNIGGASPLIIV